MFLYLFHNASMLELAVGISQIALGLADDLALIAVGSTFTETHRILCNTMDKK